jgi:hypothetical protein
MVVGRFVLALAMFLALGQQQSLPPAPVVPPQKPKTTPEPKQAAPDPAPEPEQDPPTQQHSVEMPYHGLSYSMLAKQGVTVMVAPLNRTILEYSTIQVWISNGSQKTVHVAPQFFEVRQDAGTPMLNGSLEDQVLDEIHDRANSKALGELVHAYETMLFGFANQKTVGFYEARKNAVASNMGGGGKMRALATASAIILPDQALKPGDVIDGTVFFKLDPHNPRIGSIGAHLAGATFDFPQAPQLDEHVH